MNETVTDNEGNNFIPDLQLVNNNSQRLPCVLVLDGSYSMTETNDEGVPKIDLLNEGLKLLEKELKDDDVASVSVQILVIRIGDHSNVEIMNDWKDAIDWTAPIIQANGSTPLGAGVREALALIEEQKNNYKSNGITYNRPWLFILTDGEPNDANWEEEAKHCFDAEVDKKVTVFPIGVGNANLKPLKKFSTKPPIRLKGLNFNELFLWMSQSMSVGSQETSGKTIQLPSTGWGEVEI